MNTTLAPKLGMEVTYQDDGVVTVNVDNVEVVRLFPMPPAFPISFIDERTNSRNVWARPEWVRYPKPSIIHRIRKWIK